VDLGELGVDDADIRRFAAADHPARGLRPGLAIVRVGRQGDRAGGTGGREEPEMGGAEKTRHGCLRGLDSSTVLRVAMKPRSSAAVERSEEKRPTRPLGWVSVSVAAFLLVATAPRLVLADSSTADALFRAGRKASEAHDDETAAARFAESHRLDPAPGTALNWALSEERLGHLASALEHAREALAGLQATDPRRPISKKLVDRLEARTPRLVIRLSKEAPAETTVQRDDTELRGAALGVPLPVDPGEHRLTVTAAGYEDWTTVVTTPEGKETAVDVRVGEKRPPAEKPKEHDEHTDAGPVETAPPAPPAAPSRAPAIALWAVGGGALVAGGVFGGLVLQKKGIVADHCENKRCDQEGLDAGTAGRRFSLASTIGVGVGVVGIGLGTYLWLRAPRVAGATSAAVELSPGHVGLRGSF
jgi:hypothetical protein